MRFLRDAVSEGQNSHLRVAMRRVDDAGCEWQDVCLVAHQAGLAAHLVGVS